MNPEPLGELMRMRADELTLHPACKLVPEMGPQEWVDFLADVGRRGIVEPLVVMESQVLDGRHRLRAAGAADMEYVPCRRIAELSEKEAAAFVIAAAIRRRQLSDDQRATLAAKYRELIVKESKQERASTAGKAGGVGRSRPSDENSLADNASAKLLETRSNQEPAPRRERAEQVAAKTFNVPERKVKAATTVIRNCHPLVVEACEKGEISLACAKSLAAFPLHQQEKWAKGGPVAMKNAARSSDRSKIEPPAEVNRHFSSAQPQDQQRSAAPNGNGQRAERAARVERLALIQKLKACLHALMEYRGDVDHAKLVADWPEDQADEAWDLIDRIKVELAQWGAALERTA